MFGRHLEIDRKLGKRSVRSEALKTVHTRITLEAVDARAHERGGDAKRMRIEFGHGPNYSAIEHMMRSSTEGHSGKKTAETRHDRLEYGI